MTQDEIKQHIKELLQQEALISLATSDAQSPWASVVHFASYDNFNIYWISDVNTRHSQNIAHSSYAAGTVTTPLDERDKAIGLQIEGWAGLATDINEAKRVYEQKFKKEIAPESLQSRKFYLLKPKRICLIHEPLLGFKRVEYILNSR